jgi:hypothetical protein
MICPDCSELVKKSSGILDFLDAQKRLSVYILQITIHGVMAHYGTNKSQLR